MVASSATGNALARTEFRFSYSRFNRWILSVLLHGPSFSRVTVDSTNVHVHFGWSFTATIPRAEIASAIRDTKPFWYGFGVHGWKGRWAANGSNDGMVHLFLRQPVWARVVIVPIKLRELYLSLEDPDGFLAAVNSGS